MPRLLRIAADMGGGRWWEGEGCVVREGNRKYDEEAMMAAVVVVVPGKGTGKGGADNETETPLARLTDERAPPSFDDYPL
jgi:hypothetical protein